jgi:vacuolar-type H+-ATPase subunit E/Vma4
MNERTGAKLSTAPTREPFAGGFCLQSGRIRIDASLETLVEQTRETLEGDVVKRLFSR